MMRLTACVSCLIFTAIIFVSCSGGGEPASPGLSQIPEINTDSVSNGGNHSLLSFSYIFIDAADPGQIEYEIVPVRDASKHWNVLTFLEKSPCSDCFSITGIAPSGNGTLLIDVDVSGPFPSPTFTGFDLRGIAIFNGNHPYPVSGLKVSDPKFGDGELVNPDGFTALYNSFTEGMGPGGLEGYMKGKFATLIPPDSKVNGYKRYVTVDAGNTRNAFFAGDSVTQTYEIRMPPGQLILGYALDVSWEAPMTTPVTDPMTDFGPGANCPEPWKIDVHATSIDPFNDAFVTIDVYDYQGMASHGAPVLECPEIFAGTKTASLVTEEPDYTRYEITISNENDVPDDTYQVLIRVEDNENDPVGKPWLDLSAYQVAYINVVENFDISEITPDNLNGATSNYLVKDNYLIIASGYNGIQIYDATDPANITWYNNVPSDFNEVNSAAINGDNLYMAAYNNDLAIYNAASMDDIQLLSEVDYDGSANDMCNNGPVLYLANSTYPDGLLQIVDASDPEDPILINSVFFTSRPNTCVYNDGYVYVGTDSDGIQIIDVDPPETASVVANVPVMTSCYELDVDGIYLYAACLWEGLNIIDIDPPETATIVKNVMTYYALGVDYENGFCYVADAQEGIKVIDVDPVGTAFELTVFPINWFTDSCQASGNVLYAGSLGGTLSLDIEVASMISVLDTVFYPAYTYRGRVKGDRLYVTNGESGFLSLDISNPEMTQLSRRLSLYGASAMDIEGDYAYVQTQDGLSIIDISIPGSETVVNTVAFLGFGNDIDVDGGYAYLAATDHDLVIIDVDPPGTASFFAEVPSTFYADEVVVDGGYAYVGGVDWPNYSLNVIDIDPLAAASEILTFPLDNEPAAFLVNGNYLYAGHGYNALGVIDISDPTAAFYDHSIDLDYNYAYALQQVGNYLYMSGYGVGVLDVSIPSDPVLLNASYDYPDARDIAIDGQYSYVATYGKGIQIYKLY
ncbi:MAG TPA: hypothetical protein VGB30_15020 [bacterium]